VTVQVPPQGTGSAVAGRTPGADPATAQVSAGAAALGPGHLPASALLPVGGPAGTAYLRSDAAEDFVALREEAREQLGIELYPAGPISGYRTSAQQRELWRQAQTGMGSEAAAPGTSDHEDGVALDLAQPEMRQAVDQLGPAFGWRKTEAPGEWWHVTYVGR
jgi:LAS superfamily LD-carboxypeptidase LdcB